MRIREHGIFFSGVPKHTKNHLILASYPDAIVRGIRTIAIEPDKMLWINEACFNPPSKYASVECGQAAEKLLETYNSEMLREMAKID